MLRTIQRKSSLSAQVAEALRQHVREEARPGTKLEAESKIAKRFGVSVMTVREALAALASEGLVERVHGSGTFVRDESPRLPVALIMSWDAHSSRLSFFHTRVFQRVREILEAAGIPVLPVQEQVSPGSAEQLDQPRFTGNAYAPGRISGFVFISTNPPTPLLKEVQKDQRFVAGFGSRFNRHLIYAPETMLRMALRHFKSRNRKKIAVIGWRELFLEDSGEAMARRMFDEAGFPFLPEWYQDRREPGTGDAGWQQFNAIWSAFPKKKPDGLLLMDDILYAQASQAILRESIRVPEDLLVVSHSNRNSGMFLPFPTTRLEFDPDSLAEAVAGQIIAEKSGRNPYSKSAGICSRLKLLEPENESN